MGGAKRTVPHKLPEKLKQIRLYLRLTQDELAARFGFEKGYRRSLIARFEIGTRDPSLDVLLRYARAAGISTDVLIDNELELPRKIRDAK
jgi:transcriptional regulator with XRE-family HTH domain